MEESLTREIEGACITSIGNAVEEDVTTQAPLVELEEAEKFIQLKTMIFATKLVED
jgi:hypothetical protein